MNERIKELALQAEFKVYEGDRVGTPGYGDYIKDGALEKFAELIVQECAKFLDENSGSDQCNHVWCPTPEELLQHFGVDS